MRRFLLFRGITYHIEQLVCPDNGALFPVSICWLCLCRCLDWWRCSRLETHWSGDRREASGDRSPPVRLCPTVPGLLLRCRLRLSMCNCRIWNDYLKLEHEWIVIFIFKASVWLNKGSNFDFSTIQLKCPSIRR